MRMLPPEASRPDQQRPCQAREYLWAELRQFLLKIANDEIPAEIRAELNASDLVQQSLLVMHRQLTDFRGTTRQQFHYWARLILQNRILDARRRVKRRPDLAANNRQSLDELQDRGAYAVDNGAGAVEQAVRREERQVLAAAIHRLPQRYQLVLSLREERGLTFQQIGEILNCSGDAVRKVWARAAFRLAKELKIHPSD